MSFDIYPVPALTNIVVPHCLGYLEEKGESAVFFYVSRWYGLRFTTKPQIGHIGPGGEAAAVDGNGGAFLALGRGEHYLGEVHPLVIHPVLVHNSGCTYVEVDVGPHRVTGVSWVDALYLYRVPTRGHLTRL